MSYPSRLQVLVVEDHVDVKETYDQIFEVHQSILLPVRYSFCYDEAAEYLARNKILHLVVLDLALPKSPGQPAASGVDYGLSLLEAAARRESYPVPAVLVVSGHVGEADQYQLNNIVNNEFSYGRVISKGDLDQLMRQLQMAVDHVRRYVGIGIHLRDSGGIGYPTMSPREEDLLRRLALQGDTGIGFDLEWWSAQADSTTYGAEFTKVLMGRMLLDTGDESRSIFFKFIRSNGSDHVIRAAEAMAHKLSHIKLKGTLKSSATSLVATEKVGAGDGKPVSLGSFLAENLADGVRLQTIARQVGEQIDALGDRGPEVKLPRDLLWPYHDLDTLAAMLERFAAKGRDWRPILDAFITIRDSTELLRFQKQTCLHGDLHVGNVALDEVASDVHAFIFDAGAMQAHVSVRDVAALEVSILLHWSEALEPSVVDACQGLYKCAGLFPAADDIAGSYQARNAYRLVYWLRHLVADQTDAIVYPLMVFDAAMIQVGGLRFGITRNRIAQPPDAVLLAGLASDWLKMPRGNS
jgi:CheY-like chemotaxis protein